MYHSTIGLDIAKNIFHYYEVNHKTGEITALKKGIKRKDFLRHFANKPKSFIAMESCTGSDYWAEELQKLGHEVKLISPQFVKPYVVGNKNDIIDARAIYEAVSRPGMKFVPTKGKEQRAHLMIHKARERLVRTRTAVSNEIRGFLLNNGVSLVKGHPEIRRHLPTILEENADKLTPIIVDIINELREEFLSLDKRIKAKDRQLQTFCLQNEVARRLRGVPGIGPVTASATVCVLGDGKHFDSGRDFSAWAGLVPSQHSSGGKTVLGRISKRGDCYLRENFVHGARSFLRMAKNKLPEHQTKLEKWAVLKAQTIGHNKACVAVANKLARTAWAMIRYERDYCAYGAKS